MEQNFYSYNPELKEKARLLRKNSTLSEILLWKHLRRKQRFGYDFDRQRPIGNYIVDFYSRELKMAIEIDGCSHNNKFDEDRIRQNQLELLGIEFLRFTDSDVKENIEGVVALIDIWIKEHTPPIGTPLERGIRK